MYPIPKDRLLKSGRSLLASTYQLSLLSNAGELNGYSPSQPARTKAASAKVFPTSILPLLLYLVNKVAGVLSSRNHLSLIQSLIKEPECRYSFNNYRNGKPPLLCSALLCYLSNCISCLIGSSAGLLPCSAAFPATFSNGSGDSHLSNVGCAALQEVELVAKNSFKWRSFPLRISLYGVNSCQPLDYLECS